MSTGICGKSNDSEDIVISGLSGAFAASADIYQFKGNLYNKYDMVCGVYEQWQDHPYMPKKTGMIPFIEKFDRGYFGVTSKQCDVMEPTLRHLLEKSVEAIYDAGYHPSDFESTSVGVFAAVNFPETENMVYFDTTQTSADPIMGCDRSMFAKRISYCLRLKGPSFELDTACASSLSALEHGYQAIREGKCEKALILSGNLCLLPYVTIGFVKIGMLSSSGKSRSFDESGDGYTRAEGIVTLVLEKSKDAKRIYAELVHIKCASEGFKAEGILHPSTEEQIRLLQTFYKECDVDPLLVSYVEAHGTGTKVGDVQELRALDEILCKKRSGPLYIGSVKSNCGHTEGASGTCGIVKMILAMETGFISPNLHYNTPRKDVEALQCGRMKVVTESIPLPDDKVLFAANSFGFGGTTGHVLLHWNRKKKISPTRLTDSLLRLICVSGRGKDGLDDILKEYSKQHDPEYAYLLHQAFKKPADQIYRGYGIYNHSSEIKRSITKVNGLKESKLCLFFGDCGKDYLTYGSYLMEIPIFAQTIRSIQIALNNVTKLNLLELFKEKNCTSCEVVIGTVAVQIGLANIFKGIRLIPNYIEGHGYGDAVAAYMRNSQTLEQTILTIISENFDDKIRPLNENNSIECNGNVSYDTHLNLRQEAICLVVGSASEEIIATTMTLFSMNAENCILNLLDTLGRLYQHGFEMEIDKLYPPIELPVSRGTGMISPFIKWSHIKNCKIFRTHNSMEVNHEYRQVLITPKEVEWNYVTGYVVDGKNVLPPTACLVLAWSTLAKILDKSMDEMKVAFEDVHFIRIAMIPENAPLKLSISLQLGTNTFEIAEDDSVLVTGKISIKQDEQTLIPLPTLPVDEDQLLMNGDDIYKALKLRGYYYSGGFKGIRRSTLDLSKVIVQWDDNWVEYLDYLLQIILLLDDSKELLLINNIQNLVIDAPKHIHTVRESGNAVPVYSYKELDTVRACGIEIQGVRNIATVRRKQVSPLLEVSKFIPNETQMDLPNSIRVFTQIVLENIDSARINVVEICSDIPNENQFLFPIIQSAVTDTPLAQEDVTVLTDKKIYLPGATIKDGPLSDQKMCTILIVTNLMETVELSTALNAIKDANGFVISRESLGTNLSKFSNGPFDVLCKYTTKKEILLLLRPISRCTIPKKYLDVTNAAVTFDWLPKLQDLIKGGEEVAIYSQNDDLTGVLGLIKCLKAELGANRVKCFLIMDKAPRFDPKLLFYREQLDKGMMINVWKDGSWGTYRFLQIHDPELVQDDNCFIGASNRGDLSSLAWMQGRRCYALAPGEDIVHVYYSSLNFKELTVSARRITRGMLQDADILEDNLQCLDFAGRNSIGERVMGLCAGGAIGATIKSKLVLPIPDKWTMEEAASVILPYSVASIIFLKDSRPKPGQTVLIHSATCGVGLAAINLCLHFGLTIFATADTVNGRAFLRERYPRIKSEYMCDSMDNSFEEVVYKHTDAKGVDYVVNSLIGKGRLASARCLAKGGKFLELGLADVASGASLSLHLLQKEAEFRALTVAKDFLEDQSYKDGIMELIQCGAIIPLPTTVFQYDEIETAIRFISEGKQVGKVLIKIRDEEEEKIYFEVPKISIKATPRFYCDPNCSYLIYGGLGGFGFEVASFLVTKGAKKLVLTSRSGSANGYQRYSIRNWMEYNVKVEISALGASDQRNCIELLNVANEFGPVDGIFNVAGVLADSLFENQSERTFETALTPKAACTSNLDECSRKLCPNLRYFVVFSSFSGGRGANGQTNYGMANSVVDRICERRRRDGYPAVSVQWGSVEDVGMSAKIQDSVQSEWVHGVIPQRVSSCLNVLDRFLCQKEAVVASTLVSEKVYGNKATNLFDVVLDIMGIKSLKSISMRWTLSELGADSMVLVEVKQYLDRKHGVFMNSKELMHTTLERLKTLSDHDELRLAE